MADKASKKNVVVACFLSIGLTLDYEENYSAQLVCLFGKIAFLPSPMVARNDWASNSRLFLEDRRGSAEFRVLWDTRSMGVWRVIFVEPWDSRGGDMCTSPNPTLRHHC